MMYLFLCRIVSISTVFVNKTLLSDINLDAPMFIALSQTLITAFICYLKKILSILYPNKFKFPDIDVWDGQTLKSVNINSIFLLE